jgi:hypothetical protein
MFPSLATRNIANDVPAYAEGLRDGARRFPLIEPCTYLGHLCGLQFGRIHGFAAWCSVWPGLVPIALPVGVPALGNHVGVVVGGGSQEQMCGVDAVAYIAPMADDHARWNRAVDEVPDMAVSTDLHPVNLDLSVAVLVQCPHPKPTSALSAALIHLVPCAVKQRRLRMRRVGAHAGTVQPSAVLRREVRPASQTSTSRPRHALRGARAWQGAEPVGLSSAMQECRAAMLTDKRDRGRLRAWHLRLLSRLGVSPRRGCVQHRPAFCCPNYSTWTHNLAVLGRDHTETFRAVLAGGWLE